MADYGTCAANMLAGERAMGISIYSLDEMFEIVGYLCTPGRVNSFEAEIPKDGRDDYFESIFPGQKYRPIELGYTPSGHPNKLGCQFRINLANVRNCPEKLLKNSGKGNGSSVRRINKSRFVLALVLDYGFVFGSYQNVSAIRANAVSKGYGDAFDRGYP